MGGIRDCCGYYCAFIMFIGVFFFVFTIILELTKNQFMLYHLQEFEFEKNGKDPIRYVGDGGAKFQAEEKVNNRVISMAIAIGVRYHIPCIISSIDQRCVHFILSRMCENRCQEGSPRRRRTHRENHVNRQVITLITRFDNINNNHKRS